MPKPRQRIVFCDCFDCLDRPDPTATSEGALAAAEAVARQLPPPKALLLVVTGVLLAADGKANVDDVVLPHLDRAAVEGSLGLLAVQAPADGVPCPLSAVEVEVAQLLGVYEDVLAANGEVEKVSTTKLQDRFKGMEAVLVTSSPRVASMGTAAGMTVNNSVIGGPWMDASSTSTTPSTLALAEPAELAAGLLTQLGTSDASAGPDMLMLHVDVESAMTASSHEGEDNLAQRRWDASLSLLHWLEALLRALSREPSVRDRTLLSVVLTPGGIPLKVEGPDKQPPLVPGGTSLDPNAYVSTPGMSMAIRSSSAASGGESGSSSGSGQAACVSRPVQSWQRRGSEIVQVNADAPMLVLRRLTGVVRRDRCQELSMSDAMARGGEGAIQASRLLHEIAYKMGRAPKYGA